MSMSYRPKACYSIPAAVTARYQPTSAISPLMTVMYVPVISTASRFRSTFAG